MKRKVILNSFCWLSASWSCLSAPIVTGHAYSSKAGTITTTTTTTTTTRPSTGITLSWTIAKNGDNGGAIDKLASNDVRGSVVVGNADVGGEVCNGVERRKGLQWLTRATSDVSKNGRLTQLAFLNLNGFSSSSSLNSTSTPISTSTSTSDEDFTNIIDLVLSKAALLRDPLHRRDVIATIVGISAGKIIKFMMHLFSRHRHRDDEKHSRHHSNHRRRNYSKHRRQPQHRRKGGLSSPSLSVTDSSGGGGGGGDAMPLLESQYDLTTFPADGLTEPWDWQDFKEVGIAMVGFMTDYYATVDEYPVKSQVEPGYLKKALGSYMDRGIPDNPDSWRSVMEDLEELVIPGITHWQHSKNFAWYPASSSPAGILGEMLASMFNVIGFSWEASPAATELETVTLDLLAGELGLPKCFLSEGGKGGGCIQGTASESVLVAMLAAREKALKALKVTLYPHWYSWQKADDHWLYGKMTVYTSDQAHSCVKKAAMIAGLHGGLRSVPALATNGYRIDPQDLAKSMAEDIKKGLYPVFVCANVGTTSSCAFDPVGELADVIKKQSVAHRQPQHCWLHVDSAYAGAAAVCPELRSPILNGVEKSDSFCFNPHKWLCTNFDCSALWVKDSEPLVTALSVTPEILRSKEYDKGLVQDYRDWQIPLGRKFRSLKLWLVLRTIGRKKIRQHIRRCTVLAKLFSDLVSTDERFEVVSPPSLGLALFRLKGEGTDFSAIEMNDINVELRERLSASGEAFLSSTNLSGDTVLRLCVGSPATDLDDVLEVWHVIQELAADILKERAGEVEVDTEAEVTVEVEVEVEVEADVTAVAKQDEGQMSISDTAGVTTESVKVDEVANEAVNLGGARSDGMTDVSADEGEGEVGRVESEESTGQGELVVVVGQPSVMVEKYARGVMKDFVDMCAADCQNDGHNVVVRDRAAQAAGEGGAGESVDVDVWWTQAMERWLTPYTPSPPPLSPSPAAFSPVDEGAAPASTTP